MSKVEGNEEEYTLSKKKNLNDLLVGVIGY